jgi:hypothetical protein
MSADAFKPPEICCSYSRDSGAGKRAVRRLSDCIRERKDFKERTFCVKKKLSCKLLALPNRRI